MLKGFVFDLDGVLVHTDHYHYLAWKALADEEGIYFDEEINNRLRGVSRMDSLNIILERATKVYSLNEKIAMAEKKNEIYRDYLSTMSENDVSEEVKSTLLALKDKGMKIAIGSSSKNAKFILEKVGLINLFDAISDGTEIKHSKPDPEVFLLAASLLGIKPENLAVVEDAPSGIDAAVAGNFLPIGIGEASKYEKTKVSITSLKDILKILPD